MTNTAEDVDAEVAARHIGLRDRLVHDGVLIPTGAVGIYGHDERFEKALAAVDALGKRAAREDRPRELCFPPLMPRPDFDRIEYLRNFPQLSGMVSSFHGGPGEHTRLLGTIDRQEPYESILELTDLTLIPACCYPVYPTLGGSLATGGATITMFGSCFRHEPSPDPMRVQCFRIREHVRVGDPEAVESWRNTWIERATVFFDALHLPMTTDFANDAFFGRTGRLLARNQRDLELKIEFLVPVYGEDAPTACASVNLHREHFGEIFGISLASGDVAHSSCFGFGLDRITTALFAIHGSHPGRWPAPVRALLDEV